MIIPIRESETIRVSTHIANLYLKRMIHCSTWFIWPMSPLSIRRYEPTDKQRVKDFYKFASIHSEIGYRNGPWEADLDNIEDHFLREGEFLVGTVDNEIVTIGGYRKISDTIG